MDQGSVESWIKALDAVLTLPVEAVVPGHFELATKAELWRFRNYLNDLYQQVRALYEKSASLEQVRQRSEEHTSELQSQSNLVCRLLLEKKKNTRLKSYDI